MKQRGFTLIELLVVIAIIGLLSTLAVVSLNSAREKARDAKRLADVKQVQTALELYYTDNSAYPAGTIELGTDATALCNTDAGFETDCGTDTAYMTQLPVDPLEAQVYTYVGEATTYTISFSLEGTVNNLSGDLEATPGGIAVAPVL